MARRQQQSQLNTVDEDVQSGRGRASGTSSSDGVCAVGNDLEMKAG